MGRMEQRWIVLQHVEWEGPGIIAHEAVRRGFNVDVRRLDRGDNVPSVDELDGLVVMGGPLGAYQDAQYPFLAAECRLIQEAVRRERPVLSVCLGAQLLAKALGAKVFPGHGAEIGFGAVEVTTVGKEDPLFASVPASLQVFHWHGDTFTLPHGASLLASSEMYPNQAFRVGSCAYGLQFHIEPDADTWSAWRKHLPAGLIDESAAKQTQVEKVGEIIIERFFDQAGRR